MAQASSYSSKSSPALTDEVILIDNAASGAIKRATLAAITVDGGWVSPSSYGTNVTYDPSGAILVRKVGNVVYIRGGIQATGSVSAYATVFTLPSGYAPAGVSAHLVTRYAGSETLKQIAVNTSQQGIIMHSLVNTDIIRVSGSWLTD